MIGIGIGIGRRRGGGINYNALGLVTEAYRYNNAANVEKIYYKKTGTTYGIEVYIPVNDMLAQYVMIADSGGFIRSNGMSIGTKSDAYVLDSYNNYDSQTGNWATTEINQYATQIGSTITFTFTGTGLNYYCLGNPTNVGLMSFIVDGGTPVVLSNYSSAVGYLDKIIARGLTNTQHTVVGTFIGQDPVYPSATPRGYFYFGNEITTGGFRVYRTDIGFTKDTQIVTTNYNVEMQLLVKRTGAIYVAEEFPPKCVPISRVVKIDGVDVTNWTSDVALRQCQKIEVTAIYDIINSTEPTQFLERVKINYKLDKYGYLVDYIVTGLQSATIDRYGFKMPVDRTFATHLTDSNKNVYSALGNNNVITPILNGDSVKELRVTSNLTGKSFYQFCSAFINQGAFRIGATDRGSPSVPNPILYLNNSSIGGANQIYLHSFRGHTFATGENFSAKHIFYIGKIGIEPNIIATDHAARVVADGGTLVSVAKLEEFLTDYYNIRETTADTHVLIDPHILGYKLTNGKLSKLYDISGNDFVQATSANMPIFQTWNGSNYWVNHSQVIGNFIETESIAFSSVSNTDIIFKIDIVNLNTTNNIIYDRDGDIEVSIYNDTLTVLFNGVIQASVVVATGLKWYRIKRDATTGDVIFYSSLETEYPTTWSLIEAKTGLVVGNIADGTKHAYIGTTCCHKIHDIRLYNGFCDNGTLIEHFEPNQYCAAVSDTQFMDSSLNRIFTVTRDANVTGIKGDIIYRNTAQFDGINHSMSRTLSYTGVRTNYYDVDNPNGYEIADTVQRIGYKTDAYKLAKSGMLISVKKADSEHAIDAMQVLYSNYYLNSDFFFNVRIFSQTQELEQEIEYIQ